MTLARILVRRVSAAGRISCVFKHSTFSLNNEDHFADVAYFSLPNILGNEYSVVRPPKSVKIRFDDKLKYFSYF